MDRFGFIEGNVLFLNAQYMSAFVLLKHCNFHEDLLCPHCLEFAGLVDQGGLPFPGQEVAMKWS